MLGTAKVRMVMVAIIVSIVGFVYSRNGFSQAAEVLQVLPDESNLPGYVLKRQGRTDWLVGEGNQVQEATRQIWYSVEDGKEIAIEVCLFDSDIQAQKGVNYERTHIAETLWWGGFTKHLVGEKSWVGAIDSSGTAIKGVILFLQNNVGVKIRLADARQEDISFLSNFAKTIEQKILENASPLIPELVKGKQISVVEYENQVCKANQTVLKDFTAKGERDSKWLVGNQHLELGRYRQWMDNGKVVGIDICLFDSPALARQAAEIRSQEADAPILEFPINRVRSPLWESRNRRVTTASVIIIIGKKVIHLYQLNQEGINSHLFKRVCEKLQ